MAGDRPRAPAGLGAAGKRLWRHVTGELELRGDELAVLEHAARTCDELAVLQAALGDADAMVAGSMGQPRVNPLFGELRQHRATLRLLLSTLDVDDVPDVAVVEPLSNAQASARRRWAAHRVEQAAKREAARGA